MVKDISLLIILLVLSMVAGWFSPLAPWLDIGGFVQSHTVLGLYVIALGVYMYYRRAE